MKQKLYHRFYENIVLIPIYHLPFTHLHLLVATALDMAAKIERDFISLRTTEALAKRKAAGKPLGRSQGTQAVQPKLDAQAAEMRGYLAKGDQQVVDCEAGGVLAGNAV